jgi:ketosteroid isomerase-like protein
MSSQDIEILRRGYGAFSERDMSFVLSFVRPDVELEVYTERPDIADTLYRGHEGFLRNLAELTEVFDDFRMEPEELTEGGGRIFVVVRVRGRGRSSGVSIDQRLFHVWTFRDGKVTRLEIHSDRAKALEAAGIGSGSPG